MRLQKSYTIVLLDQSEALFNLLFITITLSKYHYHKVSYVMIIAISTSVCTIH